MAKAKASKKYKTKMVGVTIPRLKDIAAPTTNTPGDPSDNTTGSVTGGTAPTGGTTTGLFTKAGDTTIIEPSDPRVAAPAITPEPDATTVKRDTQALYNTEAQNIDQAESNLRTTAIADNTGNQEAMEKVNPWYATNQAQNSRYGNLNNKDYDTTLALSRLADQFNNTQFVAPGGRVGFTTNSSFGSAAPEKPGYAQFNINTQEMRQMRANEQLDIQARQLAALLQGDTQKMYLDAINAKRNVDNAVAQIIGQADVNFGTFLQQAGINNMYNIPTQMHWQQLMQTYAKQLALNYNVRVGNLLAQCVKEAPVMAEIMYSMFGAGIMDMDLANEATLKSNYMQALHNTATYKKADAKTRLQLDALAEEEFFSVFINSGLRRWQAGFRGLGGFTNSTLW